MAGRMKKFSENTSTIPEVMDSSTLNFNPNLKFSRFFFWGGALSPSGECYVGGVVDDQQLFDMLILSGYIRDKSRKLSKIAKKFGRFFLAVTNFWGRALSLSDFRYLAPFRKYSRSKSEVVENRPQFCMFLALHFLEGECAPNFSTKFI